MAATLPPNTVIKSRAPIRLDFAGGFTDVPPYSEREGGAVVNAAITRYTYTTLVPREDDAIKMFSADFDRFVEVKSFRDLEYDGNLDMVKAAIKILGIEQGMDLYVRCDAPPGSGTGSSASIAVALIGLLNHLQTTKLSAHEIAQLARQLELQELKIAGGKQDQYAAAVGGINFIEFLDPVVSSSSLPVPREVRLDLEKHLVLCYTGLPRLSGNLIDNVMGNYEKGEPGTTGALHRLKEIAHEIKTALLTGDLPRFGALLLENWECQKRLDPSITNERIDRLFDIARGAGAIGGKALGAGGGGCLLLMADSNREHAVSKALEAEGTQIIDFNFDFAGLETWTTPRG
jgi:D-glycero-alpha-D-manno-heptose-7-phosphate kinase